LNAQRELAEEVGVVRKAEDMKLLEQFKYQDDRTSCWGNVFYVKLTDKDVIKCQEEEVAGVEYWTRDEVEAFIKGQNKKITPDGIEAWKVLKKHIKVAKQMQAKIHCCGDFKDELIQTVKDIGTKGKGILAADESNPTIGKRFADIKLENNQKNRQAYRELLFRAPDIEKHISGVIMYDETVKDKCVDGTPFT